MRGCVNESIQGLVEYLRDRTDLAYAIVGPLHDFDDDGNKIVEIGAAARDSKPDSPVSYIVWYLDRRWLSDFGAFLAWRAECLIQNSIAVALSEVFQSIEICNSQLGFVRAVESRWPSIQTATVRESVEVERHRCVEWERRRAIYIAKREREGVQNWLAVAEFLNQQSVI